MFDFKTLKDFEIRNKIIHDSGNILFKIMLFSLFNEIFHRKYFHWMNKNFSGFRFLSFITLLVNLNKLLILREKKSNFLSKSEWLVNVAIIHILWFMLLVLFIDSYKLFIDLPKKKLQKITYAIIQYNNDQYKHTIKKISNGTINYKTETEKVY